MTLLNEAKRIKFATELSELQRQSEAEAARIQTFFTSRLTQLQQLKAAMQEDNVFDANDVADVESVIDGLFTRIDDVADALKAHQS